MGKKIGRNDPCPCGSGKKYKLCCINKMSEEEIQALYLEQFELTKGLNEANKCHKILDIGKRIIEHQQNSICATGTYVNMALAKRVLYLLNHNQLDLEEAKDFCSRALELKHNNQVALRMLYGICLDLKQYGDANKALAQYEDTNIFSPMSVQIVEEYQNAIEWANREEYREDNKKGLDEITNTLFEKFGMNAGLCAVAISYYLGVGNDALKAYELGKRSVEEYPNSVTYNSLGWVCLTPEINRKDIAVGFFEKAIELAEDEELKKDITGNYFIALLENEQFKEAEKVMCDLIEEYPCNQNFSNYAELLKRQGKLEDALEWGKKALFIVEDDTTLLVVADIYKKMKQYENAVFMYQKCLEHISVDENVYQFQDINGKQLYSIASNNSLGVIMFEALDSDENQYPAELLYTWKSMAEYEQFCIINQMDNWLKSNVVFESRKNIACRKAKEALDNLHGILQYAYEYWKHNFENRHYGSFLENELMEHWVLYEDDLKRIYTFQEKRVLLNEVLLEYSLDLGPEICQEINNYCNYLNFSYQSDTCGLYDNYWRCFFEMLSTCFDILVGIKNNVDDILYRQYSV